MSTPAVDLRSDTVTRPSLGMREAIAGAEVADDVLGKDPTADRLERRVAALLGKEAALFFPSGTQANQAAVLLHTQPGTEAVCEGEAHVFHYEYADAAWLSGVQLHPVASESGRITAEAVRAAIRPGDRHHPTSSLLCLENTHNMHGGTVLPVENMRAIRSLSREAGIPVHLDGARLWNASAASGVPLDAFAAEADTVMVSLSKGLGCPIGSLLAGPAALIDRAWWMRKRLGGGMRQVGILAAAGLYALDHNLPRLPEDHERARRLASRAAQVEGLAVDEPESNIVMIRIRSGGPDPQDLSTALAGRGVLILAAGPDRLRAVTHLDVDDEGIERAGEALAATMSELTRG
ncbi:MAG: aminotransferase class I/II-fold pyridoxal phosphate-dependent enzyme [Gemmatimonadota bacterium]|jgi:threonine aldolase|nr:MAG: aminotransferase class I/II-fold pyridoxal phosphate-dependent enzyme [Gemmatimonadota bacterium]